MARGKKMLSCETIGLRLKKARKEQGLNARKLSLMADLSPSVVQSIEDERRTPGVDTVEKLALALGVSKCWLAYGEGPQHRQELNYFSAPGFDPIKLIRDLSSLLNGPGGHIEQSYKYLDVKDVDNWCSLTKQSRYKTMEQRPLEAVADTLHRNIGKTGLDVVGLGVGTAAHEIRLLSRLLDLGYCDLRLYLLDISQPLLTIASQHVTEALASHPSVRVTVINGDFFQLPAYEALFQTTHRRRRLFCMFGYTFGNLNNEINFVRGSFTGAEPGDLLLIDAGLARAPSDRREEILSKEPVLAKNISPELHRQLQHQEAFNLGPLLRYRRGVAEVDYLYSLDTASCVVPGSYAIQMRAATQTTDGKTTHFSLGYIKRYDPQKLTAQMLAEGWETVGSWSYGGDTHMVCMFRRLTT